MDAINTIESSYAPNNLGKTLYDIVVQYQPRRIVEFGVLNGYSTVHMAAGLKFLGKGGSIHGYDLWDKYPYKHTTLEKTSQTIKEFNLSDLVKLDQCNFYDWLKNPEPFDLLHLDISNDGDIIDLALTKLLDKIINGAIIVFEGGSSERDNCEWMLKYKRRPINPLKTKFGFVVVNPKFPSVSLMS